MEGDVMIQETTTQHTHCDGCNHIIRRKDAFMHDGSYQVEAIKKDGLDICPACAFEIMDRFIVKDVKTEDLKKYLGQVTKPFGMGFSISLT